MTTLAGTVTRPGVPLERTTVAPPVGAVRVSMTVPVALLPPSMGVGLTVTEETAGGPRLTTQSLAELENSLCTS